MADQNNQIRNQGNTPEQKPNNSAQDTFGNQGVDVAYSYKGRHEATEVGDQEQNDTQDAFNDTTNAEEQSTADDFAQDQFGDLDDNNPYTNLSETEPEKVNASVDPDPDSLYGLEEPLAEPGADNNQQLRHRDRAGTRISMDQLGNQQ